MDVSVSDGVEEVSMVISDVPCNSIFKLADVLLGLQSGLQTEEVEFSLEPDFALWKFSTQGYNLKLHIFPDSGRDVPILFECDKNKMIKRLYKSLRDLESLRCWKNPEFINSGWSWEFPSSELDEFKIRIKNA